MTEQDIRTLMNETQATLNDGGRPAIEFSGEARIPANAPLAAYFDHTLLKPEATADQYRTLCEQAREYGTRSVCVPPDRLPCY